MPGKLGKIWKYSMRLVKVSSSEQSPRVTWGVGACSLLNVLTLSSLCACVWAMSPDQTSLLTSTTSCETLPTPSRLVTYLYGRRYFLNPLNRGASIPLWFLGNFLCLSHGSFDSDLFKLDYLVGKNSGIQLCNHTTPTYDFIHCCCPANASFIHHLEWHSTIKKRAGFAEVFHEYSEWKHLFAPTDSTLLWT